MINTTSISHWIALRSMLGLAVIAAIIALTAMPLSAQVNQTLHYDGWILAAAHAPGLEGSIWRTDLWFAIDSAGFGPITLRFCKSATDNTDAAEFVIDVPPGDLVLYYEDVVDHFLGVGNGSWVGAIHYSSEAPVQAWARVYSINEDGTASFGQAIEGIPTDDMSPDETTQSNTDVHQWMYAVRHTADGRFRVNLGVVNPTATEGSYNIAVFDKTGNNPPGGSVHTSITVPPYSMVQLNDPFADLMDGEWSTIMIRVIGMTEGTGTFAYASVVDNSTNDAFFIRGVKRLFPDQ